jgi:hypothetical protein
LIPTPTTSTLDDFLARATIHSLDEPLSAVAFYFIWELAIIKRQISAPIV